MQLSFFEPVTTEEQSEPCAHEVKEWRGLIGHCVDCKRVFYSLHKWDGTELGAYRGVHSHPLPEPFVFDSQLVKFLERCAVSGWKTLESGLCTPYGGQADFAQLYGCFVQHGVLLPF